MDTMNAAAGLVPCTAPVVDGAQVCLSRGRCGVTNKPRSAGRGTGRCVATFTVNDCRLHSTHKRPVHHSSNNGHSAYVVAGDSHGHGSPLAEPRSLSKRALSRLDRSDSLSPGSIAGTFESVWGKPPGLPTFPQCDLSETARRAAGPYTADSSLAAEAETGQGMAADAVAGVSSTSSCSGGFASAAGGSAVRAAPATASASRRRAPRPQAFPCPAEGGILLPSPSSVVVASFNVSDSELFASVEGSRRSQSHGAGGDGGASHVAMPRRSCLAEALGARRSDALSLDSSVASSANVSVVAPEAFHRGAHSHRRARSPSRHGRKMKHKLSVFMVLDEAAVADDPESADTHNPMRLGFRGRGGASGASWGPGHSHSHRRPLVVSVEDCASSVPASSSQAFANVTFHLSEKSGVGSQHSGSVRARFGINTPRAHAVPLQGPVSSRPDPSHCFSLCSQTVNGSRHGGGECTGGRRSRSSEWNVSPAVSVGPATAGVARDRRTRPRWQVSSRAAVGSGVGIGAGLAGLATEAGMDESAYSIISFDFDAEE